MATRSCAPKSLAAATISAPVARNHRCLCEIVGPPDDSRLPWDYAVLCSTCCKRSLRSHIERHEQALLERDLARERCAQRLARVRDRSSKDRSTDFSQLQFESQRLRDRRAELQKQCAAMAVEVASLAVENEERREALDPQAEIQRLQLQRLDEYVCEGVKQSIEAGRDQIKILRFQWALKAFAMHRLDVRPEDMMNIEVTDQSSNISDGEEQRRRRLAQDGQKKAKGIGKISGLPLPHAGPELYGVLPPQELQSALRLVASISSTVARCLGILLPHPVLLQSTNPTAGDNIHSETRKPTQAQSNKSNQVDGDLDALSTASLVSLLETSLENSTAAARSFDAGKRQGNDGRVSAIVAQPSMDSALVAQRLRHATAAVLSEADTSSSSTAGPTVKSSQYALGADNMHQDEFAIALQFLQNNVIALCIRAGVPVAKLWPADAVLLNLYALQVFCEDQVKQILK